MAYGKLNGGREKNKHQTVPKLNAIPCNWASWSLCEYWIEEKDEDGSAVD